MKKIIIALVMGLMLVTGSVFGKEATGAKNWWVTATSNGVVQLSTSTVVANFGTQENLDICIANNWEASAIASALKGKTITLNLSTWLYNNIDTKEGKLAFIYTVATGYNKYRAMGIMQNISKATATDGTFDAVFAMPDVVVPMKDIGVAYYCIDLSQKAKKVITPSDLTIQENANWLLLGGATKYASQVTTVKKTIKKLTTSMAKRSLRAKGKSFVSTTSTNEAGVVTVINPIEQEMKPIVDALNAPKLDGLEAALAGIGVDVTSIVRDEAIWDAITAEKDAIFYGDKVAHPVNDGGIILLLGPEGYNAWVKSYNEGSK